MSIRRLLGLVTSLLFLLIVAGGGYVYYRQLQGVWPAVLPPSENIVELLRPSPSTPEAPPVFTETTSAGFPLRLPAGFHIEIFADKLPGARVMVRDDFGNFWVSQTGQGTISQLELRDGKVVNQGAVFRNLNNPHGLALDPANPFMLYIAEEDKISRVALYSEDTLHKITDLPSGDGHYTRTIAFGPDGRLYVSVGSSCNVCVERDARRAAILSMNKDGGDIQTVATGLRNSVFFDWSQVDGRLWATDMGRDLLGDDTPPEEINIITAGSDYGWPYCYGQKITDTTFATPATNREYCASTVPPQVELPAHSAPLGLAFIPEEGWPEEYWHNLLVAYHGSWNRSEPTGYKVVRVKLDKQGRYLGTEDFIDGWLRGGEAVGRPVDVLVESGGVLYISDDKAGVIYRVFQ